MSAAENNERVVRRFLDRVLSGLSPEVVEELVSADVVDHHPLPGQPPGREGLMKLSQVVGRAFNYLDVDIGEIIGDDDRMVARWTARPPRGHGGGATASISGIDIFRVADGTIVERWSQSNLASVLEQTEPPADTETPPAADTGAVAATSASTGPAPYSTSEPSSRAGSDEDEALSPIDQDRKALRAMPELGEGLKLNERYRYCFVRSLVNPAMVRPVIYTPRHAVVDDRVFALAEADIILGEVQEMTAIADGIINSDPATTNGAQAAFGVAITGDRYRWPGGRVAYRIDPSLPSPARVTNAINHWQQRTGGLIQFVQRTSEPDYVTFRRGQGCASSVGRIGGQQFVELALTCTTGNVIHEIGHAIGLWHEQSREDRDRFVTITWANITPDMMHNFFQHITDGDDIGAYDYASIMHYNATAFSRNGAPTIATPHGEAIGQRVGLSDGDVAAVRALYAGRPAPVGASGGWWDALEQSVPRLVEALRGVMDESDVRAAVHAGARGGSYAGTATPAAAPAAEDREEVAAGTFR